MTAAAAPEKKAARKRIARLFADPFGFMFAEFGALIKATFYSIEPPMAATARRWTELSSRAVTAWGDELTAEHSSDDVPVGLLLSELDGIINHLSTNNSKTATQKQQHVDDRALWAAEASDLTRERDELASQRLGIWWP